VEALEVAVAAANGATPAGSRPYRNQREQEGAVPRRDYGSVLYPVLAGLIGGCVQIYPVNPSDVSFGVGVITPRWLCVLAGATPRAFGCSRRSR
jgi:hypothetical protein